MEKNINLAKILNGKPVNTKLWSPLFGDVYTSSICSEDTIIVVNHHAESSSFYNTDDKFTIAEYGNTRVHYSLRPATDSEKQQLFDALAKKGKRWDAEKKQIVDLKPNIELKPFDKVLIRDFESQAWQVSFFGYKDRDSCYCCNGCSWNQCIPYIGNESLLGTTKDVEG